MGGQHLPVTQERERSMATRLITKGSGGKTPAAEKAPAKKGVASKKAVANGPAASPKATPAPRAKKRLPAAAARPLKELKAGEVDHDAGEAAPCPGSRVPDGRKGPPRADAGKNLTRYVNADDPVQEAGDQAWPGKSLSPRLRPSPLSRLRP